MLIVSCTLTLYLTFIYAQLNRKNKHLDTCEPNKSYFTCAHAHTDTHTYNHAHTTTHKKMTDTSRGNSGLVLEAAAHRSFPPLITCHMTCADNWRELQVLWLNTRAASASDTPSRWPPPAPTWRCSSPGIWILLKPIKQGGGGGGVVVCCQVGGLKRARPSGDQTYQRAARCHFLHAQHHFLVKRGWPEDLRDQASTARFLRRESSSTEQHLVGLPAGNDGAVLRSVHFSLRSKRQNGYH